jgi:hypothetical protein
LVCFGPKLKLRPPLAYACSTRGCEDVATFLLDQAAKIDIIKVCGKDRSPLVHAVCGDSPSVPIIKKLLAGNLRTRANHISEALCRMLRRPSENRSPEEREVMALLIVCGGVKEKERDRLNKRALAGAAYFRNQVTASLKARSSERRDQAIASGLAMAGVADANFPLELVLTYDSGRPRFSPGATLKEFTFIQHTWLPADARHCPALSSNIPHTPDIILLTLPDLLPALCVMNILIILSLILSPLIQIKTILALLPYWPYQP